MREPKQCPNCGTTFEDFRKTSLLGCAVCYSVFREELLPAIRRMQGKTRHKGTAPAAAAAQNYEDMLERVNLRESLERALREERYADAREIEKKLIGMERAAKERKK